MKRIRQGGASRGEVDRENCSEEGRRYYEAVTVPVMRDEVRTYIR